MTPICLVTTALGTNFICNEPLLPSSATVQAQAGLSWLYSQLIQPLPEKFYLTKASWYLAKVVLSLAQLQIVSTFFLVNQNCHRCLFYGHFPKLKTFAVLWWNLGVDMQSDQWTVHLGSHMATCCQHILTSQTSKVAVLWPLF